MQFWAPTALSVTFKSVPTTGFSVRRLAVASMTAMALGLGVAACGGGDDGGDETPAPVATTTEETVAITQEELISQGDEICEEANSALGSIEASTADETTKSDQVADIYDGIAEQLGDLGTPSDGDPPTDVIAAAQNLANGSTDVTEFQTAATEYGFTACAEAPDATSFPTDSAGSEAGTDSGETYVPPVTESVPETAPAPAPAPPPSTGGGVAPSPPDTGGSTGGGSGGSSSGGIGPG